MGLGIALVASRTAKVPVVVVDNSQKSLDKGLAFAGITIHNNYPSNATLTICPTDKLLAKDVGKGKLSQSDADETRFRLTTTTSMDPLSEVDMVIEAVPEIVDLKKSIFAQLAQICPSHAILATNTSSISITQIARATTQDPTDLSAASRVVSTHFMNPVPVQKGVEIISGLQTSASTLATAIAFCKAMGKIPSVSGDSPGFLANRILMPYINEAIICLETGVGGEEDIDGIMKNGTGVPMGPLALADFIGLDTCLSIMEVLHTGLGDKMETVTAPGGEPTRTPSTSTMKNGESSPTADGVMATTEILGAVSLHPDDVTDTIAEADTAPDQITPASARVLDTTELLEAILIRVNVRTALSSQRVCRKWRDVIGGSVTLQKKLFIRTATLAEALELADLGGERGRIVYTAAEQGDSSSPTGVINPLLFTLTMEPMPGRIDIHIFLKFRKLDWTEYAKPLGLGMQIVQPAQELSMLLYPRGSCYAEGFEVAAEECFGDLKKHASALIKDKDARWKKAWRSIEIVEDDRVLQTVAKYMGQDEEFDAEEKDLERRLRYLEEECEAACMEWEPDCNERYYDSTSDEDCP
ncbi:hypothetical protein LTR56_004498 [Elasticomyces elasticus]|nr:hypothetical protein LTR56_004498 [Elasticomyces elasticus]KAK3654232.1 hypothetical protein LTR22_010858 [Elasticomyces elasticus]